MASSGPFLPVRLILAMGLTLGPAGPSAAAEDLRARTVVELFTSQSCSSCPPADALLGRLMEEDGVVALSYHVDYWNYLGWEDTLSDESFTDRQYGYARAMGRNGVYTPQMVINGRTHVVGSNEAKVRAAMSSLSKADGLPVAVGARREGDRLVVSIGAGAGEADVLLVNYRDRTQIDVGGGENAGRQLTYYHSVRDIQTVGMWDGEAIELILPESVITGQDTDGCAILLQRKTDDGAPGPIIGAVAMEAARP